MSVAPALDPSLDPRFPNLRPEVVRGYLDAPEHLVAEVLDGELLLMSRPRRQHAHGASRLGVVLGGPFDFGVGGPGGWIFLDEPELHLGPRPDIVVPDLAGWRRERIPSDFLAENAPAHVEQAPDWVCEVLSDSTEATDRGTKMRIYRREGVGHLWLLDARRRTLEVWKLDGERWRRLQGA
jgi:Uma2 family endonuclease